MYCVVVECVFVVVTQIGLARIIMFLVFTKIPLTVNSQSWATNIAVRVHFYFLM